MGVPEAFQRSVELPMKENSGLLKVPRIAKFIKGGRTSYSAPKLWNSLPDNVRGSDYNVRGSD